jgi:hypothetical protein
MIGKPAPYRDQLSVQLYSAIAKVKSPDATPHFASADRPLGVGVQS